MLSAATRPGNTVKVKVMAKAKCPNCNHEFDAEFEVEQKVAGGVVDFDVRPGSSSLSNLCMWKT